MLKINMGAHKGRRCRNGTILGISLILIFSSGRMAWAAENAVKQAETAVVVGYSVSFIDAENANHLIFHTQTGKVLEGTSLNVSFPEQIIGSDGISGNQRYSHRKYLNCMEQELKKFISNMKEAARFQKWEQRRMPPCWRFGNAWNDGNRVHGRQSAPYLGARMRRYRQRFRSDRSKSVGK